MQYKCGHCGKITEKLESSGNLRCVHCGYKIFYKVRQPIAKKVKAR